MIRRRPPRILEFYVPVLGPNDEKGMTRYIADWPIRWILT